VKRHPIGERENLARLLDAVTRLDEPRLHGIFTIDEVVRDIRLQSLEESRRKRIGAEMRLKDFMKLCNKFMGEQQKKIDR